MFCKWCGTMIEPTDTRCHVCGRETPPLSDCGGLYQLKTTRPAEPAAAQVRPAAPKCPIVDRMETKYAKDAKQARSHYGLMRVFFVVTFIVLLVILALLTVQSVQLVKLGDEMERFRENAYAQQTEPAETESADETQTQVPVPETEAPEQTEEPTVAQQILAEQDVTIELTVADGEAELFVDLDEYTDTVSTASNYSALENLVLSAKVEMVNSGGMAELLLTRTDGMITLTSSVTEDVFGTAAETAYEWQCRADADGSWELLDANVFTQDDDTAGTKLSYTAGGLTEGLELRCIVTRRSEEGGSISITVEGIIP